MKRKTNISVQDNTGIRVTSSMHVGEYNGYPSGDILDANATVNTIDNTVNEILGGVSADFDTLKELSDGLDSIKEDLDKVFFATYGVTTYNEVEEALNNGKVVYVDYRNSLMTYSHGKDEGKTIYFSTISMDKTYYCTVNVNNTWSVSSKILTESVRSITYSSLKTTRDGNSLTPGQLYRITDYVTTTAQADTQSAGHQFDIIVRANAANKLSETAWAIQHDGDTYFANSKLEAWQLKYCLDNDTNRFAWADTTNGKGVIYYMKDEWNNECPYDFKNIQHYHEDKYVYVFGGSIDVSLDGYSYNNKIDSDKSRYYDKRLPKIIFGNRCVCNYVGIDSGNVIFGDNCIGNRVNYKSYGITFGNNCEHNLFFDLCNSVSVGSYCKYNFIKFGKRINIGNNCRSNTLFNCNNITINAQSDFNKLYDCEAIVFEKQYTSRTTIEDSGAIILTSNQTTGAGVLLKNITIAKGVNRFGTGETKTISHNTVGDAFNTTYRPANSQVIEV